MTALQYLVSAALLRIVRHKELMHMGAPYLQPGVTMDIGRQDAPDIVQQALAYDTTSACSKARRHASRAVN